MSVSKAKVKLSTGSSGPALPKCPTGIRGLDEITLGGVPQGRPTLICGGPGCGKTMLGMEFLVRGATLFDEPGVCMSFEETAEELALNVASLGFDVDGLVKSRKLSIDYVFIDRSLIEETGEWDLEACSFASATPSIPSARDGCCSTASNRSSPAWPMSRCCAASCAVFSAGSRKSSSPRWLPRSADRARSPAMAWKNIFPTA